MNFNSIFKQLPNAPFLETLIIKVDADIFLEKQDLFAKILQSMTNLKFLWICMPDAWEDYFREDYFSDDHYSDEYFSDDCFSDTEDDSVIFTRKVRNFKGS